MLGKVNRKPISCPECFQGFMLLDEFSPSKLLVLTYRGHSKVVATQVFRECSICSYSFPEPLKDIDLDQEMVVFKREVNIKILTEDL